MVQFLLMDLSEMTHAFLKHLPQFNLSAYDTALGEPLAAAEKRIYGKDRKARAYLSMGDREASRVMLEEVIAVGDESQVAPAVVFQSQCVTHRGCSSCR